MKIGMILDEEFPPDPRVENEAIALINAGHTVFLFCLSYNDRQASSESINKIQVKRYLSTQFIYKLSALAYTVPLYKLMLKDKIKHFLQENKIDAIHIHDLRIADTVFSANQKLKLPTILDLHENRPEIMKFYPHLTKFPGKFLISPKKWKKNEEKFIKKADKVIVVTQESKKEIIKRVQINADKIIDVPNTVRKDFFKKHSTFPDILNRYQNHFVLLYIGDTGLRRGLQTAIKSLVFLSDEIPNIKLVVVGKNSTDAILKQLAKDLKVEKYVDFLGWKDPKYFSSYILSSAVCISPLHRNLHHDTTYANKIFQYMSFGKPLLVSDATAQQNLTENYKSGLVHKAEDVNDFADKTIQLYKNEALRNKFGENGKDFVRNKFSWEQTSKKLIHLYDNLLN
ncbi:glycosyl transferase [Polaribacter reichenbachii]|uniref:Glycosyl transferase n=1 Tax=Polaribacter reichenbachii TaxID=996801 RepID=A0A1B8U5N7_9FLAO|nr:glycosyltransferase family 4 protein [Polaribacter reichenbachii]APZ46602.1 glycosyl transferase [Polaribacter reichenbachii]AUC17247.1 glycosyl transferase [Polaribacter reichenbachii]OBY67155.1 glycosyl transferase [Polaribacter reichenbachii]